MRMPFGKFKGKSVSRLPDDYLEWLWENIGYELQEPLRSAVAAEIKARFGQEAELRGVAGEIVAAGYRTLAQRYHPDHGGDHLKMVALNEAHQWLRSQCRPAIEAKAA